MNNKKKIIFGSIIGVLVGTLLSVSYAMYTYNNTGMNNKLIVGDIYMRYKETSAINLNGAMPSATYPTTSSGNYFEFQIIGKNTNTTKDITYNVKLAYGDTHGTRNTRIDDEYLVFKLVEVVNGVEQTPALVEDQSYDTIPGATLYTTTIPKNTTNETTRTFRVYARISENVVIGNVNQTYTEAQWNNLYASVKINVDGGFAEPTGVQTLLTKVNIPTTTPTEEQTCDGTEDGLIAINTSGGLALQGDTIREYRYSGGENCVKNYIWFNNENWRIVGILDSKIKIVKDTPISSAPTSYTNKQGDTPFALQRTTETWAGVQVSRMYWNKDGGTRANLNDWSEAGLMYYLNEENSTSSNSYYDTMNGSYKGFIDSNTTYYLGNVEYYEVTPSMSYTQERNTDSSNLWSGNPGTWTGKIGLLYPSDYGYATDPTVWNGTTTKMYNYNEVNNIKTRNWILKLNDTSGYYCMLSPSLSNSAIARGWNYGGVVDGFFVDYGSIGVRPVLNLKSDTIIVSGEGTSGNPYRLIAA